MYLNKCLIMSIKKTRLCLRKICLSYLYKNYFELKAIRKQRKQETLSSPSLPALRQAINFPFLETPPDSYQPRDSTRGIC